MTRIFPFLFFCLLGFSVVAPAELILLNGSFENSQLDTADGTFPNRDLVTDWFEESHGIDVNTTSDESTEQALEEGGNRPLTDAGSFWGHFIDRTEDSYTPAMFQNLGTWNSGDATLYEVSATLGDRSNQFFGSLLFEFYSGDVTGPALADGTSFFSSVPGAQLLDQQSSITLNGSSNQSLMGTASFNHVFDLQGLTDGDEVYLRISMPEDSGFSSPRQSLIDDITLTAIPEPSTLLLMGTAVLIGLGLRRRR